MIYTNIYRLSCFWSELLSQHFFASYLYLGTLVSTWFLLKNGYQNGLEDGRSNSIEESHNKLKLWDVSEICEPSQCQFLQLPIHPKTSKVWHLYVMLYWTIASSLVRLLSLILTIVEHDNSIYMFSILLHKCLRHLKS